MITCGYRNGSYILPLQVLDTLFAKMVLLHHIYKLKMETRRYLVKKVLPIWHFQGNTLINKLTFDLPYNLQEKPDVRYFYLTSELGWSKCAEER